MIKAYLINIFFLVLKTDVVIQDPSISFSSIAVAYTV